jgi:hypothetical protein
MNEMQKILRTDLNTVYQEKIKDCSNFFPTDYISHGFLCECNFGGLCITLDNTGESAILVRDWAGDDVMISDILEIEYFTVPDDDPDLPGDLEPGIKMNDTIYLLSEFMRS